MIHPPLHQSATPGGFYSPKWGIDVYPLNRVETAKHLKSNNLIFSLARGEGGGWTCPPLRNHDQAAQAPTPQDSPRQAGGYVWLYWKASDKD